MRMRFAITVLAVLGLAATGCGNKSTGTGAAPTTAPLRRASTTTVASDTLAGTAWDLVSYQGPAGTSVDAVAGAGANLTFAPMGVLSGSTGCNSFQGTYTVDGSKLTLDPGAMTLRGCEDPARTAQEAAITQGFPKVTGSTVTDTTLTLTSGDGATLFTWRAAATGLAGTSWKVTGVNNGKEAVVGTQLTEALTAQFGTDGSFSGSGGCNQLDGPYSTSGKDVLTIGPLASTEKGCTAEIDALEQQYRTALQNVTTYELAGNMLTMRDAQGATQVTATRAS